MKIIQNKKVFYSGLIYLILVVVFIAIRLFWQYFDMTKVLDPSISDLLFTILLQTSFILLPLVLYKVLCKQNAKQTMNRFFFHKVSLKTIGISLLIGVLTYIIVIYISTFWYTILELFGYSTSSSTTPSSLPVWLCFMLAILTTAILPALGEETSHRGLVLGNMRDNGLRRAVILSALLFGLMHLNVTQFGYAFVVGIVLATVTLITRSIFPAMIIHGTSNFCSIYISYASTYDWFGIDFLNSVFDIVNSQSVLGVLFSILILSGAIIAIKFLLPRLFIEAKRDKFAKFKQNLTKSIQGTEMEGMIDVNNPHQMVVLFNEATAKDMQNRFDNGKLNVAHLEQEFQKSPTSVMMYSEIDDYTPPRKMDNICFYIAIFLLGFMTFATFIWGAM